MIKKLIPLTLLANLSVACSSNNSKAVLAKSFDSFLTNENKILVADIESVSRSISMDAGFLIYISEKGCSSCEAFNPILTSYVEKTSLLTYKFDVEDNREDLAAFQLFYGDRFFKKNSYGDYQILTPSLYVIQNNIVEEIDYDSYMKASRAFENYLNSRYIIKNHYFIHKNVSEYDLNGKSFSYVSFNKDKEGLANLYKTKILPLINQSDNVIVISDVNENETISTTKYENGAITQTKEISTSTSEEEIRQML